MEVEVAMAAAPSSPGLLNMSSGCSSPYISAPSSPQRSLTSFYSAPASPRRSTFFSGCDFEPFSDDFDGDPCFPAVVPFNWEFKPGVPKPSTIASGEEEAENFEFEFKGQPDVMIRSSLSSADELFAGGKIRPLKPPPPMISAADSPKSPRSPISKFRDALSPKQRKKSSEEDPFETAFHNTTKFEAEISLGFNEKSRGRSKNLSDFRTNSRKGISRSLSTLRVSEFALLNAPESPQNSGPNQNSNGENSSVKWGGRKWRLKDFLLFRSASEGRASSTGKDPLKKKYFSISSAKKDEKEAKISGNMSSSSMADGSISRRSGQVSAPELHYNANRAVSEDLKKKTLLPCKHGFLCCLGFNPAFHDISQAFKSSAGCQ